MSSSDKTAEYAITADPTGFQAGMDKAISAAKEAQSQIAASMGGIGDAFKLVKDHLAAFTAILGGGKMFKDGIAETLRLTGETTMLAKSLGISMTAASTLNVALKGIGSSADVYTESNAKLIKQVRTNEDGVKAMGVATRGANGEYLNGKQLMSNAIEALKGYKEGTDRNLAAQVLFGKGAGEVAALLKLTDKAMEEAEVRAAALGLVIGPEQAAKTKIYKEAMNDVRLVMEAMQNQIGQAVMPILTQMGQWFSSIAPTAIQGFSIAMETLSEVFDAVAEVAKTLWSVLGFIFESISGALNGVFDRDATTAGETFINVFRLVKIAVIGFEYAFELALEGVRMILESIGHVLLNFGRLALNVFTLNWGAISSDWASGVDKVNQVLEEGAKRSAAIQEKYNGKIEVAAVGAPKSKDATPKDPTGNGYTGPKDKDGKEVSNSLKAQAAVIKAELEGQLTIQKEYLTEAQDAYNDAYKHNLLTTGEFYAAKLAIEQQGFKGAIGIKEEELRQLQALQAKAQASGKQSDILGLKAQELKITAELTVLNAQAANTEIKNTRELTDALQQKQIAMQEIARVSQQQVGSAQIDRERIMLGESLALRRISDEQAIAAEAVLQERLFQIDLQALQDKTQQLDGNLEKIAANNAAIEQLERTHQTKIIQIKSQAVVASNKDMTAMNAGIRSSLESSMASMMQGTMTLKKGLQAVWGAILQGFTQFVAKKVMSWALGETAQTGATVAGNAVRVESDWMAATQSVMANAWSAIKNIAMKAWEAAASVYASIAAIPYVGPFLAPVMAVAATGAVMGFAANIASARGGYDIPAGINPLTQLHEKEMVLPQAQADAVRNMTNGGGSSDGGTIQIVTTGGQFIHKDQLATLLKKMKRNFEFV